MFNHFSKVAGGAAWIGASAKTAAKTGRVQQQFGGYEHASLRVNFNMMPLEAAPARCGSSPAR